MQHSVHACVLEPVQTDALKDPGYEKSALGHRVLKGDALRARAAALRFSVAIVSFVVFFIDCGLLTIAIVVVAVGNDERRRVQNRNP